MWRKTGIYWENLVFQKLESMARRLLLERDDIILGFHL